MRDVSTPPTDRSTPHGIRRTCNNRNIRLFSSSKKHKIQFLGRFSGSIWGNPVENFDENQPRKEVLFAKKLMFY